MNNFVKGTIFGAGFGLGIVIIALIVIGVLYVSPLNFGESPSSIVGTNEIIFNDDRLEFKDGIPIIYGSLVNDTEKELSSVIVQGSLFSEDECFIDKADEYIASLSPGEQFGFKIRFHDWKEEKAEIDIKYKVRITQGFDRE